MPSLDQLGGFIAIPGAIAVLLMAFAIVLRVVARNYIKVPPNRVAVFYGRKYKSEDGKEVGFRVITGGAKLAVPLLEEVQFLDLTMMAIDLKIEGAPNRDGVTVSVEGVANVKILSDEASLMRAVERFLGKDNDGIRDIIFKNLEGHLRGVIGKLSIEELVRDREKLNQQVLGEAGQDLSKIGVAIDVLTIQRISDAHGYIDSLGKTRTAEVQRDAEIGQAEATRDASIRKAEATRDASIKASEAERAGEVAKAENQQKILDAQRDLEVRRAEIAAQVAAQRARADMAGPKSKADAEKEVAVAQVEVERSRVEAEIALQQQAAIRKEKELEATVLKEAEAERRRKIIEAEAQAVAIERTAEGQRKATVIKADADATARVQTAEAARKAAEAEAAGEAVKIKQVNLARAETEAAIVQQRGLAEAEATRARKLADAEGEKARLLAAAEGERAMLLAKAEGEKARLLAEAEGIQKKAAAYKALDESARFQLVLDRAPVILEAAGKAGKEAFSPAFEAMGKGLAAIDKVTIIDSGSGDGANPVQRFASTAPGALFGLLQQMKSLGIDPSAALDKLGVKATLDEALQPAAAPPATAPETVVEVPQPPEAAPAK